MPQTLTPRKYASIVIESVKRISSTVKVTEENARELWESIAPSPGYFSVEEHGEFTSLINEYLVECVTRRNILLEYLEEKK